MDKTISDKLNELILELELIKAKIHTANRTIESLEEPLDILRIYQIWALLGESMKNINAAIGALKGAVKDEEKT